MIGKFIRWWYGDFSKEELEKYGLLFLIFGLIIGTYWLLRPLKDGIFMSVIGENYIPHAKILSLIVVFPLVVLYSKLVDLFPRQKMFYALCTIYGILALIFAFLVYHPSTGLANTVASPYRWWCWGWYVYVESFGSLIVALFWAFAADTTTPESAARGYPIVALGGQLGNIFGPLTLSLVLSRFTAQEIGPEGQMAAAGANSAAVLGAMVLVAGIMVFLIMGLIRLFMTIVPADQLVGFKGKETHKEKDEEPGFFEGLRLIFSSKYLLGIFAIITAYEVIVTVLDFNFKTLVKMNFPDPSASTAYLASYGSMVGAVSFLSIILGINKIQRAMGLGVSLAMLPLLIACAVVGFKLFPVLGALFWIMVLSKAINYALNQPSMKQLYIPTSKQAKYKSQAFIEMYGSRGSKAMGSGVNLLRKPLIDKMGSVAGLAMFISICTYVSLGIIAVWFLIALFLGRTFNKAVEQNEVVV